MQTTMIAYMTVCK